MTMSVFYGKVRALLFNFSHYLKEKTAFIPNIGQTNSIEYNKTFY